jgi:hypothetical protein
MLIPQSAKQVESGQIWQLTRSFWSKPETIYGRKLLPNVSDQLRVN